MGNFFKSLFSSKDEETENTTSKTDRKNFDIFKYDGVRAQRIGQLSYAIKCFEEAINIQEDYETMGMLATAYLSNHQFEEALEITNHMIDLEPEETSSYLARVNVLFMMDNEAKVIPDCMKVIELEEENFAAWYLMAKAKKFLKDYTGAAADLSKAILLKDDFINAWQLRAEIYLEMGQYDQALSDIVKVLELSPEEETAYLLRGRIHEAMKDYTAATNDYNMALELNPFNEEASLLSASMLIKEDRPEEAIELLNEMIELKPDFAKAYSERSKAKELLGDKDGALEDYKKAEELNPNNIEVDKQSGQETNFDNMYKGGIY